MTHEIENAKREIRREIAGQIDWFMPEGEKHFDPVSVIAAISTILIGAFLKGFIDEATKVPEEAGRTVFKNLKDLIMNAFKGGEGAVDETERDAQRGREIAQSLSSDQRAVLISQTETEFRESLLQFMPEERAVMIVSRVRTSVVTHILESRES